MLNLQTESILSLAEAAAELPSIGRGRKIAATTIWRWTQRGCGGVKLEALPLGGRLVTSREALQRFCEQLQQARAGGSTMRPGRPTAARAAAISQARGRLSKAGVII